MPYTDIDDVALLVRFHVRRQRNDSIGLELAREEVTRPAPVPLRVDHLGELNSATTEINSPDQIMKFLITTAYSIFARLSQRSHTCNANKPIFSCTVRVRVLGEGLRIQGAYC